MRQYEAYSVLITDEKGKRGTGTLFYAENAASFYVLTCAHVIYTRHLDLSFQTISKRRQEHCAALIEHIRSAVTLLFWKPWR